MNYRYYMLLLASLITLGGCDQMNSSLNPGSSAAPDSPAPAPAVTGTVIATVNGNSITQNALDVYANQRKSKGAGDDASQETILDELIALELMRQEADNKGLTATPKVAATLDQLQRSTLAGAAINDYMENNPVSDEAAQKLYDEKIGTGGKEYKARHILVETEEEANTVVSLLDGGQDFSELAKEKSTGPSGPSGGELGWFGAGQMVKPFSDATAAMEKGSYTKTPVKTQFGWHVIMLDDTRESTPPPFDDVKERIKMMLTNQNLQKHIETIKESASIEIK
ncbi:MAG: peptidylprolyl isomerase [Gammaproteobacteria bacterium]|nr:peptidylprolyl isomerase [Gammaproteobacteria bacterium]